MRKTKSFAWGILACLLTPPLACATSGPRPYTIVAPALTCEQAHQQSSRVMERLGYTVTSSSPAAENGQGEIRGARSRGGVQETVTVKISCLADGVQVNAEADIPPCEQANRLAQRTVEQLGYNVTSAIPAVMNGRVGTVKGKRQDAQAQDTVTLTITCTDEAVYVDTRSDSPLVVSSDFTAAISDFRRGFFALFKPLADEAQRQQLSR